MYWSDELVYTGKNSNRHKIATTCFDIWGLYEELTIVLYSYARTWASYVTSRRGQGLLNRGASRLRETWGTRMKGTAASQSSAESGGPWFDHRPKCQHRSDGGLVCCLPAGLLNLGTLYQVITHETISSPYICTCSDVCLVNYRYQD
jgi:hypothetical protein